MCIFNGCSKPSMPNSTKCQFHRHRLACFVENCNNIVYARQLCVRHGGKPQCAQEGCDGNARPGGFCYRHTTSRTKRVCSEPSCKNAAHARGKCVRHGGGRQCQAQDCTTLARKGGYCVRHSRSIQSPSSPQYTQSTSSILSALDSFEPLDECILDELILATAPSLDLEWQSIQIDSFFL